MLSRIVDLLWGSLSSIEKGLVISTLLIYAVMAVYSPSARGHVLDGLNTGTKMLVRVSLLILAGIFLGAIVGTVLPKELIARSIGGRSGITGILLGTLIGSMIPGGPYVVFPLVASFYSAGASIPALIAMVFAWTCVAVTRLPFELGIMSAVGGQRFVLYRLMLGIPLPIIAGLLAGLLIGTRF
ncbi:MAG: permease [Candidatus Bathyarchaeia archaeon]